MRGKQSGYIKNAKYFKHDKSMNERDRYRIFGNKIPIINKIDEPVSDVNQTNSKLLNENLNNYNKINSNNITKNIIFYKNNYTTTKSIKQSIIISYKESTEERKRNLKYVLNYLLELLDDKTEIILVEQDTISKINWLGEIPKNEEINYIFVQNSGIFNKGWGYNIAVKEAKGDYLIFHDSDIFLKLNAYSLCLNLLNKYDVVDPYNRLFNLNKLDSNLFLSKKYDFNIITNKSFSTGSPIAGGIFMIKKEKYLLLKGFDEDVFGYGPEDRIFDLKINKLGLSVYNIDDFAIHIYHDKFNVADEYYQFGKKNDGIYEKYKVMSQVELIEKIKNTNFINNIIIDSKKTLNQYFSKIYCINLDSRPDKYKECLVEFAKLNVNVERISGIDGKPIFKPGLNLSAGNYGLLLTNIKIIEDAIINNYKNILILEDDVMFIDGFYEIFNEKILSLPDNWDLLYLGGNNLFEKGSFNLITGDKNFNITKENYKTLKHELCKTTWTQTTHAVAINSKFYEIIMNSIRKNMTQPIDLQYCILQQAGYNAYTFLPSLALQRPSFSDIENIYVDYNKTECNF